VAEQVALALPVRSSSKSTINKGFMNFSDYQNQTSSEKIVLATLDASKRLMGWTLHSGSIYKLTNITYSVIESLEDSGSAYTEVASIVAVTASKFYLDRDAQTLYIRTTGSDNPNSRFIVGTFKLFFSNVPLTLPHDLDSGREVYWEPLIKKNSSFGVEIDTIQQTSEAIEGKGSLTLHNDQDFWPANFDKLIFENNSCSVYSYSRDLAPTEAQLIFRGRVETRTYSTDSINFTLNDLLSALKNPVALSTISDLGERNSPSLDLAFQRMIFGRVFGFRPTNIDEVIDSYPITGTISVTQGSASITGSGTSFYSELSPDDELIISGVKYTVGTVSSNTAAALTSVYESNNDSGLSVGVIPQNPKRWTNRVWKIAGHALREPVTMILSGSTVSRLRVVSTDCMFDGDQIYVGTLGSGELVTIDKVVNSQLLKLSTSLASVPEVNAEVRRPCVQNVRLGDLDLRYYRDYTVDATAATLTLLDTAEANASALRQMPTNLSFTNASRTVTGTGLDSIFAPGYMVGRVGQADMFQVHSVSETSLTLTTTSTYGGSSAGLYKSFIFNDDTVLTCDVLGRTDDGLSSGQLLRNAPEIVEKLLIDLGLEDVIDSDSFTEAKCLAGQDIGMLIPAQFNINKAPIYRDVINLINKSVLGSLVQTNAFQLSYLVIQPHKSAGLLKLTEPDILDFSLSADSQNMIKTAKVEYRTKEYDYLTTEPSISTAQQTSDHSNYVLRTDKEKIFTSYLVEESDAQILANRWSMLLERSSGSISLRTKLQGAHLEVGDIIDIEHSKLFVRFGGTDRRRIVMVEKITKNGKEVAIEAVDLSNSFNRIAHITNETTEYASASDEQKLYGGYITDEFGMIDNDPETFGQNIIF
jgi:putative tail protein